MTKQEKIKKFNEFAPIFEKNRSELHSRFVEVLVKKLKPYMEIDGDLIPSGKRTFTRLLVELGYPKGLGTTWENSSGVWGWYSTWFYEVWNAFEDCRHLLDEGRSWKDVQWAIENNI